MLVSHTSIRFFEIPQMTIPQIEAILTRLGKHISLKLGIPVGGPVAPLQAEHTVDEAMQFMAQYNDLM